MEGNHHRRQIQGKNLIPAPEIHFGKNIAGRGGSKDLKKHHPRRNLDAVQKVGKIVKPAGNLCIVFPHQPLSEQGRRKHEHFSQGLE